MGVVYVGGGGGCMRMGMGVSACVCGVCPEVCGCVRMCALGYVVELIEVLGCVNVVKLLD